MSRAEASEAAVACDRATDDRAAGPDDAADADLVTRCLAGEEQAWPALLGRYGRLIGAVIRRYGFVDEDHADLFQDVCLALWQDLPRLRDRARLGPWIVTVTSRHAWDARRRARPWSGGSASERALAALPDGRPGPDELAASQELGAEVRAAVARLSPRHRRLLEALYFEEGATSYADVAHRLGWSPNSIGPIRARCFKELRATLAPLRAAR